uniref:Uncharacterized protein n=1 Tax=Picea glauca TaxID=3330 RepID=A0A101LX56_PICGL|nr:hypothetical protein ABT39_MTgene5963 [Picea glauca]
MGVRDSSGGLGPAPAFQYAFISSGPYKRDKASIALLAAAAQTTLANKQPY